MTTSKNNAADSKKKSTTKTTTDKGLETQMPLSEKDEVKQAERRMSKSTRKN